LSDVGVVRVSTVALRFDPVTALPSIVAMRATNMCDANAHTRRVDPRHHTTSATSLAAHLPVLVSPKSCGITERVKAKSLAVEAAMS
jgi:hypothetical protein